jgi:hypothetical protein
VTRQIAAAFLSSCVAGTEATNLNESVSAKQTKQGK